MHVALRKFTHVFQKNQTNFIFTILLIHTVMSTDMCKMEINHYKYMSCHLLAAEIYRVRLCGKNNAILDRFNTWAVERMKFFNFMCKQVFFNGHRRVFTWIRIEFSVHLHWLSYNSNATTPISNQEHVNVYRDFIPERKVRPEELNQATHACFDLIHVNILLDSILIYT